MTLDELGAAIDGEGGDAVLVEFCVPHGCARCDQMRAPIERLAREREEWLTVGRVDLNRYPQLAWEFGLTDCPSYVAFRGGEEVLRTSAPASVDLIASGLDRSRLGAEDDPLSAASH